MYTTKHNTSMIPQYEDNVSDIQGITRINITFLFATVALNPINIYLDLPFFPIHLDLKVIYEKILLTNKISFT